jgi:aspartate aminotransferase
MNIKIAHRAMALKPSPTLAVSSLANKMRKNGVDVVNFGVGEPDFDTPKNIKEAAIKAINDNFTRYTSTSGISELRQAICKKLKKDNNLNYNQDNILVSPGAKAALVNALLATCDLRDEVLIPAPYWVSYLSMVELVDAIPVIVPTTLSNNFKIKPSQLEKTISELSNPKALILNSPSNPSGIVYSKKELERIAEVCMKNDIFIISDEIYEKLIYDNQKHISIASLSPKIKNNTIVINGVSKAYAMTGWRLGYMAGPKSVVERAARIQSHTTSCVNSVTQKAAIEALLNTHEEVEEMRKVFEKRRDYLVELLSDVENIKFQKPKGAFYLMVNVSYYIHKNKKGIDTTVAFCKYLLEEYHVALVPGSAFGAKYYVRFSFANSFENIKEGVKRFRDALENLIK